MSFAKKVWQKWAWLIVFGILSALLGWERALAGLGSFGLILIGLNFLERFRGLERSVQELQKMKNGEQGIMPPPH